MNTLGLILREIAHRKLNFLLGLIGVVGAVTLFVFFDTSSKASAKETARIMRNIGLNLRIIPKATDMNVFWATGISDKTMPEDYVDKLASQRGLNYAHLLPTLQQRIVWQGREIILTGVAPEKHAPDKKKPSMSYTVKPGTLYVGHLIAQAMDLAKGSEVELKGKRFVVARALGEMGNEDDIRVYADLGDVQEVLNLPGKINEIKALNCLCATPVADPLAMLREQLAKVLPDAEVIQIRHIADAREKQRRMVERYVSFIMPFVMVIGVVWVGLLAMLNVRERQNEIGILRAIGHGSGKIAGLFLGKSVLLGIVGGVVGFAVGTGLAEAVGPDIFRITAKAIKPLWPLLWQSIIGASLFAAAASLIPTTMAVTQDPAVTLSQE